MELSDASSDQTSSTTESDSESSTAESDSSASSSSSSSSNLSSTASEKSTHRIRRKVKKHEDTSSHSNIEATDKGKGNFELKTNDEICSKPKQQANSDTSDFQYDNSMDSDSQRRRSTDNKDLKTLIDSYPDVYGVRRSSRCRKEPERYTLPVDSDSDDNRKSKRRSKRKTSSNYDDDTEDEDEMSTTDSNEDSDDSFGRSVRKSKSTRSTRKTSTRACVRSKGRARKRIIEMSTEDEDATDLDDDEDDDRVKRTSRKKISYKEQSDHTDTDDLVEVDWGDYNAEQEEQGETIEKVLEHRIGRKGATGPSTTYYNIDKNGDPNDCNLNELAEKEQQLLIKWKGKSYLHCTWETEEQLKEDGVKGMKKIENYLKKEDDIRIWRSQATPEDIEYYDCQEEMAYQLRLIHNNVERIITHQEVEDEETGELYIEYLCKFEGLPYAECNYESEHLVKEKFQRRIDEYYARQKSQKIPCRNSKAYLKHRPKFIQLKSQPDYIGGKDHLQLRDYQLDGLNWLAHSYSKGNSVLLADEMGLGKTIQTICFFNYLSEAHGIYGPFLMVVPLSTMAAWQKEFEQWAPELNFIVYIGDVNSRNLIRQYEWSNENTKQLKFNVLLTTYEILLKDRSFLGSVSWSVLGVDEAHRLKNDDSLLYKSLQDFDTNHRLLVTGTPLQNSLRELWALLHFIMPDQFQYWEEFESEYQDCDTKGYSKLHKRLEPYLIRRVKKDVEKSLPAKVEQILRVEMTSIQKQYYKWILTKNFSALAKGLKGSFTGFANIMMELKKCCNHATLIRPTDEISVNLPQLTRIIRGSGKLVLLDKLLVRLKETGHRVLIFSQMVRMLDILSDYLTYRRFSFQRLDGSIRGELRKQALDHFNAEGSPDFCFLLSTRAGGLGINLATADTVIIFDSDFNPQNDLQAQARAHRIGQKNQVNIYRLVTKSSVEEDIIERAKRKMVLDHLVIQRMDTTGRTVLSKNINASNSSSSNTNPFSKEELAQILKFGAEELFKEGDTGEEEPQVDIDEILKRAETREEPSSAPSDELLGAFKVASFNFNEEDVNPTIVNKEADKDWSDIIPEAERKKLEEEEECKKMEELGPRSSRKSTLQNSKNQSDSEEEYDPNAGSDDSEAENSKPSRRRGPRSKKESNKELIHGFSEQELRRFIKSYKKFAVPMKRLDSIAMDAELQEKPLSDLTQLAQLLQTQCENAIKEHETKIAKENLSEDAQTLKKKLRSFNFKFGGVTIYPRNILTCQQELEPLEKVLPKTADERKKWTFDLKIKNVKEWDVQWTIEDDSKLLVGCYEYGIGNWEQIKMDPSFCLEKKILLDNNLKPQAKQLQTRVDSMLKLLNKFVMSNKKTPVDIKSSKKKAPRIKNENSNSMEVSTNGNENELSVPTPRSKKRKNTEEKKKSRSKSGSKKSTANVVKEKEEKKKKKKRKQRDLNEPPKHYTAIVEPQLVDGDLSPDIFAQCKEKMRPVKKALKQLDNPEKGLNKEDKDNQMMKCLLKIGDRITHCLDELNDEMKKKEWRNNLWTFVSKFTEYDPKKLYKIYKHTIKKQGKSHSSSSDRHHSSNNGDSNHHYSHHYHHHHNSSSSSNLSNTVSSTSNSQFYAQQPKQLNNNKFNTISNHHTQRNVPPTPFQSAKDPYHHYSNEREKRGLSSNSPNKRIRPDDQYQQRSVLSSTNPVSPNNQSIQQSQLNNRSSSSWHQDNRYRHGFQPQRNPSHLNHQRPSFRQPPYQTSATNLQQQPTSQQSNYYQQQQQKTLNKDGILNQQQFPQSNKRPDYV